MIDTIDILLLCAMKEEYDQVLQVRDGLHGNWHEHPLNDGWMVADACFSTTAGETLTIRASYASFMGREQAQATASRLIHQHEQGVRCIAMSGICAGRRGKLTLGDVIFADRLWSYDAGKVTNENGSPRFQGDALQYKPPNTWIQRMQHLIAPNSSPSWINSRPRLSLEEQENWVMLRVFEGIDPRKHSEFTHACPDWTQVLPRLWQRGWLERPLQLTPAGRQYAQVLDLLPALSR